MSEPLTDFELRLAAALRSYVDDAQLSAPTQSVVASARQPPRQARSRLSWLLPVGAAAALLIIGAVVLVRLDQGTVPAGGSGSNAAKAIVADREYFVGTARELEIRAADLTPYAPVSPSRIARDFFAEMTAYRLAGVDPTTALVVPAKAGLRDDSGALGEYWLLRATMENVPELCPYHQDPKPAWCR